MKKLLLCLASCIFASSAVFAQDTSIGDGSEQSPYGEQTPWIFKMQRTQPQAETVFYYMPETSAKNGTDPVYSITLDVPNIDEPKQSCYYLTAIYVSADGKQTSYAYGSRYDLPLGGSSEKVTVAAWGTKFVTYSNKAYIIGDSNWTGMAYIPSSTNGDTQAEIYFNSTTNTYKSLYTINGGASNNQYLAGLASASFANSNSLQKSCLNKATVNYATGSISFEPVQSVSLNIQGIRPFVAPIDVTVPAGVSVFTYASCENGVLTVEAFEGDVIPANTPVILKVNTSGEYIFDFDGTDFKYNEQTSPRTFLEDSQYESYPFYGVHGTHYVPENGYIFDGEKFIPAASGDIVSALQCYVVATDAPESISIVFPEEEENTVEYYLANSMTAEYGGAFEPNPSYKFREGSDENSYTLTVGSMDSKVEFYVIEVKDGEPTAYSKINYTDMEPGEDGAATQLVAGDSSHMSLNNNYVNITFTLTLSNGAPYSLSYNGTVNENTWNITPGNDQTNQSGTITGDKIEFATASNVAVAYIYAPSTVEDGTIVYYELTEDPIETAEANISTLDAGGKEEATITNGYFTVTLKKGYEGTISVYESQDSTSPAVEFNYSVSPTADPLAVETIEATDANDGAVYNIFGQKVDENYKGIVIKNGKKYIQR